MINLTPREFQVKNNGRIFDLRNNQQTLDNINRVVSVLNTSSHYNEKNIKSAGMNGLGAKLVCLTQKLFQIEVCNNNMKFTSTWFQMKQQHQQQLQPWNNERSFSVRVQLLDKGYQKQIQKNIKQFYFEDLDIPQIQFYLQHLPLVGIRNVILNGKQLQYKSIQQLYNPEAMCMIQYQNLQIYLLYKGLLKDNYYFINGLLGYSGSIFNNIRQQIKEQMKLKDEGKFTFKIIILGYHQGLKFSGQIKDTLNHKFKDLTINKDVENFIRQIQSGKKVVLKNKYIEKYIPANLIQRQPCSLILTEGDSAASLFQQFPETFKGNFYDTYGLFPLRGKVLNTFGKQDIFDINNKEIQNIISIIGFQQGVHYNQQNINNLRYQSIIIASDYDDDGFHIKGLILNVFIQFWPELIDLNFFKQFTTPIIVADGKNFYQEQEFKKLSETYNFKSVKYLKGLGSIDKKMHLFKDIVNNLPNYLKLITYNQQDKSWMYLLQALFDNKSENRKQFIINYVPQYIDHKNNYMLINDILSQQVVQYSFKTLERAIPCFMDGLKDSQRKIIYLASIKSQFKEKVANFAADVSKTLDYHHGEDSLAGATVELARDCVGTNNVPLLQGEGSFGSNWDPSKNAAYRYIYVSQSPYLKQLIRNEDKLLYKYRLSDDGKQIEPQQLYPILPLFLLNGTLGVASGWSSTIPCFNINDIKQYIICYLREEQLPILHPKYNNYLGKTQFVYDENNHQYFECQGVVQEDQQYIYIIETHLIKMCKAKLFDDLSFNIQGLSKEEKEQYEKQKNKRTIYDVSPEQVGNNIIKISKKKITNSQFQEIYNKYIFCRQKCENMTLIKYDNDKIIPIKYHNVYTLLNDWINNRLYYYILRKERLLRKYIYEFIVQYNYKQVNDNKLLKDHDNTQLTYYRLSFLTPYSKIKQLSDQFKLSQTTLQEILQYLQQAQQQIQSQDKKEYDYIMTKSLKFFVDKDYNLDEIYQKFISLYNKSGKDIWISELQSIIQ